MPVRGHWLEHGSSQGTTLRAKYRRISPNVCSLGYGSGTTSTGLTVPHKLDTATQPNQHNSGNMHTDQMIDTKKSHLIFNYVWNNGSIAYSTELIPGWHLPNYPHEQDRSYACNGSHKRALRNRRIQLILRCICNNKLAELIHWNIYHAIDSQPWLFFIPPPYIAFIWQHMWEF